MKRVGLEILDRRQFVVASGAGALALLVAGLPGAAKGANGKFEDTLKKLIGDAVPAEGTMISLKLPEVAENGNSVALGVSVESPMSADDHVKAVHILSEGNPVPMTASYRFTVQSGRAEVSSRIRLAQSQNVFALAEMSDGRLYMTKALVKVTVGGCGAA